MIHRITERVNSAYLGQATPRPFPSTALADLFNDHLTGPVFRRLLDPALLVGINLLLICFFARAHWLLWLPPLLLIAARMAIPITEGMRRIADELALLRYGLLVRAHVLRMHPRRNSLGTIEGVLLDCAIVVQPRRTYIGSVWLSDGLEALRLSQSGRVMVICLPRAPGTWRIAEMLHSELRYDYKLPAPELPEN